MEKLTKSCCGYTNCPNKEALDVEYEAIAQKNYVATQERLFGPNWDKGWQPYETVPIGVTVHLRKKGSRIVQNAVCYIILGKITTFTQSGVVLTSSFSEWKPARGVSE